MKFLFWDWDKALQTSGYIAGTIFLLCLSVCMAIGTYMLAAFVFFGTVWNLS